MLRQLRQSLRQLALRKALAQDIQPLPGGGGAGLMLFFVVQA